MAMVKRINRILKPTAIPTAVGFTLLSDDKNTEGRGLDNSQSSTQITLQECEEQ